MPLTPSGVSSVWSPTKRGPAGCAHTPVGLVQQRMVCFRSLTPSLEVVTSGSFRGRSVGSYHGSFPNRGYHLTASPGVGETRRLAGIRFGSLQSPNHAIRSMVNARDKTGRFNGCPGPVLGPERVARHASQLSIRIRRLDAWIQAIPAGGGWGWS